jgi:uncharacterized membrane protein
VSPPPHESPEQQQAPTSESPPDRRKGRRGLIAVAALLIGYAALSYYSNSTPDAKGLGVGLALGPVLLIGLILVWRWTRPLIATLVMVSVGAVLYRYWSALEGNYEWADLAQQCAAYGLLAFSFGRSLMPGRTPLCTQLADKLHGPLVPEEITYTRRATAAWTVFYLFVAAAVAIIFFAEPLSVWSMFVNFATYGLIALMFIADYSIRHHTLPRVPRSGILAALQQFLLGSS